MGTQPRQRPGRSGVGHSIANTFLSSSKTPWQAWCLRPSLDTFTSGRTLRAPPSALTCCRCTTRSSSRWKRLCFFAFARAPLGADVAPLYHKVVMQVERDRERKRERFQREPQRTSSHTTHTHAHTHIHSTLPCLP